MADTLTHIYKYPRVLTDVPTHIIDVWNLNIGGDSGDSGEEGVGPHAAVAGIFNTDTFAEYYTHKSSAIDVTP